MRRCKYSCVTADRLEAQRVTRAVASTRAARRLVGWLPLADTPTLYNTTCRRLGVTYCMFYRSIIFDRVYVLYDGMKWRSWFAKNEPWCHTCLFRRFFSVDVLWREYAHSLHIYDIQSSKTSIYVDLQSELDLFALPESTKPRNCQYASINRRGPIFISALQSPSRSPYRIFAKHSNCIKPTRHPPGRRLVADPARTRHLARQKCVIW